MQQHRVTYCAFGMQPSLLAFCMRHQVTDCTFFSSASLGTEVMARLRLSATSSSCFANPCTANCRVWSTSLWPTNHRPDNPRSEDR
jgi:hypothetical protein